MPDPNHTSPLDRLAAKTMNDRNRTQVLERAVSRQATSTAKRVLRTGDTMTGGLVIGPLAGSVPLALSIPASSDATSERAELHLGDWGLGQDSVANGTKDFYVYQNGVGFRMYLKPTLNGGLVIPGPNGGWQLSTDSAYGGIYNILKTASQTGGDYVILSAGGDTYISSGAGSSTYLRGPSNNSSIQIQVTSSQVITLGQLVSQGQFVANAGIYVNGNLTMASLIIGVAGEYMRNTNGSYQTWYSGATRLGYIQHNGASGLVLANEAGGEFYLPGGPLRLASGQYLRAGGNAGSGASGGNGGVMMTDSGANYFHTHWDGNMRFYIDSSNVKTFVIPHPVHAAKRLVHAVAEGPTSDVFYRGRGQLVDGFATIVLPDYFEALTELEGRTVSVTPILDHAKLLALGPRQIAGTANLCCTEVEDGRFHVSIASGMHVWDQVFHWRVDAVRKGTAFEVEPDVATSEVAGDGPYTYIVGAPSSPWPRADVHGAQVFEAEAHPDATLKVEPLYNPEWATPPHDPEPPPVAEAIEIVAPVIPEPTPDPLPEASNINDEVV